MACNKKILASCIGLRQGLKDICLKELVEESTSSFKARATVKPKGKKGNEKNPKDNSQKNLNAEHIETVATPTSVKTISGKKKGGAQTQVWVAKPK